jgi:hypothetical protein
MSISAKAFIPVSGNVHEALNKALYGIVRLLNRNSLRHPERHPLSFVAMEMGGDYCFYVTLKSAKAPNQTRALQIGCFEDTIDRAPAGPKISFSMGSFGESDFIMKSVLLAALQALGSETCYFTPCDACDDNDYQTIAKAELEARQAEANV